jgi:molecular chaperone DnaJ
VVVETPVKLTDKQKELLRELERLTVDGGAKHSPQSKGWMDKVKDFFE